MKFILHIGTHKTGTTAIQHFFRKNDEIIRSKGLWYPNYDLIGMKKGYAHHEVAHTIAGKGNFLNHTLLKEFIEKIKSNSAEGEKVLISAEPFCRHLANKPLVENSWRLKELYVERVAKVFGPKSDILFVIRRQDKFATSLYQETVKVNRYSKKFSFFLNEFSLRFNYLKNIRLWQKYFDNVNVVVFEDLTKNGNLEFNFAKHLGIKSLDGCEFTKIKNESLPSALVEFKRLINGLPLSLNTLKNISTKLLNKNIWEDLKLPEVSCYWPTPSQRDSFLDQYEEQNRHIKENYYKISRDTLFPNQRDTYPNTNSDYLPEELFLEIFNRVAY